MKTRRRKAHCFLREGCWLEVALLWVVALSAFAGSAAEPTPATALDAYQRGNFRGAQTQYGELAKQKPEDPRLRFNAGASAYRQNDLTNSAAWFESVLGSPDLNLQQQAYYNLGNTRFKLGEGIEDPQGRKQLWGEALTNFAAAVKLNGKDTNAIANYAFVRQRLEELQQQQQQQQQNQQPQQQPQSSDDKKDSKDSDLDSKQSQDSKSKSEQQKKSPKQDNNSQQPQSAQNQSGQDPSNSEDSKDRDGDGKPDEQPKESAAKEPAQDEKKASGQEEKDKAQAAQEAGQPGKEGTEQGSIAEGAEERPGEMSVAQAMRMLEGQKGDEKALLMRAYGHGREAAERAARIKKPW
ncbi:MAG TPA: tetratricopeptide repeat protein [Verrucomicrobiota bacterium]|nr:tetratricopeptide repeat protein [Verrucomicrobiota bacterium]